MANDLTRYISSTKNEYTQLYCVVFNSMLVKNNNSNISTFTERVETDMLDHQTLIFLLWQWWISDYEKKGSKKRCYIATPITGKKIDLQLYDGEVSPGMQNRGSAFIKI